MKLRDYQRACLTAIFERYKAGVRRQLVCLPTGTGKTVVFASFPEFFRMKNRMLVLAHREELLEQAAAKLRAASPGLEVGIEQGDNYASPTANVVLASVATIGRTGSQRLERLDPSQFNLIVVDEAHHAIADSWQRVLDHFGVFAPDSKKLLVGFTATPKRMSGDGLETVFQEIVFERDIKTMIALGYLSPIAAYRVETTVDLTRVRTKLGDFAVKQLAEAVNTEGRNGLVVKVYEEHLASAKTVVFCVDVAHARNVAQAFRDAGISAAAIDGEMPSDARKAALRDFSEGRIRVLTNCMVLTEGYDEPSIEGIILARPTKSTPLYTQMIGRGTRLHEGKRHVTVIDIVDVTRDRKLVTLPSLFGFPAHFDMQGQTTGALERALVFAERQRPWVRLDIIESFSELEHRCKRINLLDLQMPEELEALSFTWMKIGETLYRLPIGHGETLALERNLLGAWDVTRGSETLKSTKSLVSAAAFAEDWIRKERAEAVALVQRQMRWRNEAVSDKQEEILRRNNLELPARMSRGDASRVIGMLFAAGK